MSITENSTSRWTLHKSMLPREVAIVPILITLGILVNNILLLITFRRMRKLQVQHFFMIGLALADLQTILPYSVSIYVVIRGEVWLTDRLCNLLGSEIIVTIGTTTWLHSAMCIEKCFTILKPIQHRAFIVRSEAKRMAKGIIVACFIFPQPLLLIYSFFDLIDISFRPYTGFCSFETSLNLILLVLSFFIVIPIIIQIVTTSLMLRVTVNLRGSNRQHTLMAMRTVGLTIGIYWACWIPFVIDIVWSILPIEPTSPDWMEFVTGTGVLLNSGMSCLIYKACLPHFKKEFTSLIRWCCCTFKSTLPHDGAVSSSGNLQTFSSGTSVYTKSVCDVVTITTSRLNVDRNDQPCQPDIQVEDFSS